MQHSKRLPKQWNSLQNNINSPTYGGDRAAKFFKI
jgi:hypothetical protein